MPPVPPVAPVEPVEPVTPIKPPGVIFLTEVITVPEEAFPAYPRFVKVTEVELPIAFTEKYPAVSK
jgi:hypothetical protein